MQQSHVPRLVAQRDGPLWRRSRLCALIGFLTFTLLCSTTVSGSAQETAAPAAGSVSGVVLDPNGGVLLSARIRLTQGKHEAIETGPDGDGRFVFSSVMPGEFQITVSAEGFVTQNMPGELQPGEALNLPPVSLSIVGATTEVRVSVTNYELAEEQIKVEETQRVLGVIPNFYVTYDPAALPLKPKQKFEIAWKTSVDPVTFAAAGAVSGVQQAADGFKGYGQGSQGYAKRFGANYADSVIGNMIGGAILPSILKQDPRYFYKGTGTKRSRVLYALANAVVCKGDNGHWQPDYSGILGALAAGGISNLYYPASNRSGAGLTFENTLIGIGGSAGAKLFQEFLVSKLTPHAQGKP